MSARLIAVVGAALLFGCPATTEATAPVKPASPPPQQQRKDVTDPDYKMETLPMAKVLLPKASGGTVTVEAEVAYTNPQRERGLMWRRELADGKGMLFLFPTEQWLNFWMRNTLIPLDMVFIDSKFEVAGVVENAAPQTLTGRGVGKPSKYVLEVPGGWAAKIGLKAGAKVKFEGTESITATP